MESPFHHKKGKIGIVCRYFHGSHDKTIIKQAVCDEATCKSRDAIRYSLAIASPENKSMKTLATVDGKVQTRS